MIWLDSIFFQLAMWVAEKIPKLSRKDQLVPSDEHSEKRNISQCVCLKVNAFNF